MSEKRYECPACGESTSDPLDVHESFCPYCRRWSEEVAPHFYNVDGERISMREWSELLSAPPEVSRRFIGRDKLGELDVSTVWLGLDHSHGLGNGPPVIFETIVFKEAARGHRSVVDLERYSTLEGAQLGHEQTVARLRAEEREGE